MAAPDEFEDPSDFQIPGEMLPWLKPAEIADLDQVLALARDVSTASVGFGKTITVLSQALYALEKMLEYQELVEDRRERGFV